MSRVTSVVTGGYIKLGVDVSEVLGDMLKIVKLDIQKSLDESMGMDGKPLPRLEPSTIARKRKPHVVKNPGKLAIPASKILNRVQSASISKGASSFSKKSGGLSKAGQKKLLQQQARYVSPFPDKPLVDSGNLLFNQTDEVKGNYAVLRVGPTRAEAAEHLQVTGVGKKRKKFYFFGVSPRAEAQLTKYAQRKFDKALVKVERV